MMEIPAELAARAGSSVVLGARPQDWRTESSVPAEAAARGEPPGGEGLDVVNHVEQVGAESLAHVRPVEKVDAGPRVRGGQIAARLGSGEQAEVESRLRIVPAVANFFNPESEVSLEYLQG